MKTKKKIDKVGQQNLRGTKSRNIMNYDRKMIGKKRK